MLRRLLLQKQAPLPSKGLPFLKQLGGGNVSIVHRVAILFRGLDGTEEERDDVGK